MSEIEWSNRVRFHPWVGKDYDAGIRGKQILVVGESHYGEPEEESERGLTQRVVQNYRDGKYTGAKFKVFTVVARLLLQDRNAARNACRRLWDRLAFYNFLQRFKGEEPQEDNTIASDWIRAGKTFDEVYRTLEPDVILFVGKTVWGHVRDRIPSESAADFIIHPSARRMTYDETMPKVDRLFRQS